MGAIFVVKTHYLCAGSHVYSVMKIGVSHLGVMQQASRLGVLVFLRECLEVTGAIRLLGAAAHHVPAVSATSSHLLSGHLLGDSECLLDTLADLMMAADMLRKKMTGQLLFCRTAMEVDI